MSEGSTHDRAPTTKAEHDADRFVREALHGLQFGTVTLIVQDGVVIQIDRTEKRRLPRCK